MKQIPRLASSRFPAHRHTVGTLALCAMVLLGCSHGDDGTSSRPGNPNIKQAPQQPAARNVILMINDGAGWGTWDATAYWQYGDRRHLPYADFPHRYGMSTYPLNDAHEPSGDQVQRGSYDPSRAWDTTATDQRVLPFAGYQYLDTMSVDSAAAGTALASGRKTYNSAINVDNTGKPLPFITQTARQRGKATGVVTSVPFSHATPAAFGAQNRTRTAYPDIARQMLHDGQLDLIFGAGAPGYNINGTPCAALAHDESTQGCTHPHEYLSEEDWRQLETGRLLPAGARTPWTVIRDKATFEALARGEQQVHGPLFGSPAIAPNGTLQQQRQASILGADERNPSGIAFIRTVPTLATMTQAALRHLGRHREGFFLMVEGGATDWAAHTSRCTPRWDYGGCTDGAPQYGQLIEESADFNQAVEAVIDWVEANSNWDETLLIITSDHDNSMPMGTDADQPGKAFQPVINNGQGRMPGFSFRATGNHSNALVPLWAKGAGAEAFARLVRGKDPGFARHVTLIGNDGSYIDNTDVHQVMHAALTGSAPQNVP